MIPLLLAAANIAPVLMKFINAGPTAEKIAGDVSDLATVVSGEHDPIKALEKIQGNTALQQEFQLKIADSMQRWNDMFLKDVQNARDRDIKLAQAGFRNNRANWLVIFSFTLVIALLAVIICISSLDEWVKGVLLVALGRAWGYMDQIYNFEFGTTKQSAAKDQTIANLSGDK